MSSSPPQQSPSPMTLPASSTLSPAVVSYLNSTFSPKLDLNLSESTHRVSQLDSECSQLTHKLADLTRHLEALLLSYASSSDQINGAFHHVRHRFDDLKSASSSFDSNSDGGGEQMVAEELPELAKEVARVEMARDYAAIEVGRMDDRNDPTDKGLMSGLMGYGAGRYNHHGAYPPSYGSPYGYPPSHHHHHNHSHQSYPAYPPPGGYPPSGYPPPGGYPPAAYPPPGPYPPHSGYYPSSSHHHSGHGPNMGMLAGGAAAAAALYGVHHLSHGHHGHHGHHGYGYGHSPFGFGHHGKFKHGKFGKHHGMFGRHKFKKWK